MADNDNKIGPKVTHYTTGAVLYESLRLRVDINVETVEDRDNLLTYQRRWGMIVYIIQDDHYYRLVKKNDVLSDNENWESIITPFKKTFNSTVDWEVTAGGYKIDFNHGFGESVHCEVRSGEKKISLETITVTENIERIFVPADPDLRFEGSIIIAK